MQQMRDAIFYVNPWINKSLLKIHVTIEYVFSKKHTCMHVQAYSSAQIRRMKKDENNCRLYKALFQYFYSLT